jgi:hypothetical protein
MPSESSKSPLHNDIVVQLGKIETQIPFLYKRHYLGYLSALKCGDFEEALTHLRKYFDYSIKNKSATPVQYSALNLAALYTKLNFPEKALSVSSELAHIIDDTNGNALRQR